MTRKPTADQAAVLCNEQNARIRIVRAVPGSGKTWLVAEVIRRELSEWHDTMAGIAALSFTRVGGEEIRKAVGYDLDHPHFVGTIDAFLFRYVIRPFLRKCFPPFAQPRLIPADWDANKWGFVYKGKKATVRSGINLFDCVYIDEEQGKAVVAHKPHPAQPLKRIFGTDLEQVREGKKQVWRKSGNLTHSDAALWASKVLSHSTFGSLVRSEIVRRFPLLIVDELQDTGFFLGKSIRLLLEEPTVRAVLVGDPDQAIFEFNGARPDLFDSFEATPGSSPLPLARSLRCPSAVTTCAQHVKHTGGQIDPREGEAGHAFLLRYMNMVTDVNRVIEAIRESRPSAEVKVVARLTKTVKELAGRSSIDATSLHCPPLHHIFRAVTAFRQGHNVRALTNARVAIERAIFQYEGVADESLDEYGIDLAEWKALAVRVLLNCNNLPTSNSLYDWQTAAGKAMDSEITRFNLPSSLSFQAGRLSPQKRKGWNSPSSRFLPNAAVSTPVIAGVSVQTVHGVKGETHDVTVLVCPASSKRCPSLAWWSDDERDREERRIAYVAMTRTRCDLLLCVSDACFRRLREARPEFVSCFECLTVDEWIALQRSNQFDKGGSATCEAAENLPRIEANPYCSISQ